MKFKSLLLLLVGALGIVSCTNENIEAPQGEGEVMFKLEGIDVARSRVAGSPMSGNSNVQMKNLYVVFSQGDNQIMKARKFKDGLPGWDKISVGQGVVIEGVPKEATKVAVFGNVADDAGFEALIRPNAKKLSDLKSYQMSLKDMQTLETLTTDADNNSEYVSLPTVKNDNVPFFGENNVTGSGATKTVNVSVAPILARIELGNLQCKDLKQMLNNIYVKRWGLFNVYSKISMDGARASLPIDKTTFVEPGGSATGGKLEWAKWLDAEETQYNEYKWAWETRKGLTAGNSDVTEQNKFIDVSDKNCYYNAAFKRSYHWMTSKKPEKVPKWVFHVNPKSSQKDAGKEQCIQVRLWLEAKSNGMGNPAVANKTSLTAALVDPINASKQDSQKFDLMPGKIYKVELVFSENDINIWNPEEGLYVNFKLTVEDWKVGTLSPEYV